MGRICWSPTRRAQCARLLGHDDLPGRGRFLRPGSAGRNLAGTVCLFAGSASTHRPDTGLRFSSSASAAGAVRRLARDWAHPTLSSNVVAQGPSQSPGQPGRRSGEEKRGNLRAGSPAGPGVKHPVAPGRCGVLTRRGPVSRVAQWQDSDRFSEPPPGPWNRAAAGGGCCRSGVGPALRMDLAPHRTTLHAPNRFHLVRCRSFLLAMQERFHIPCGSTRRTLLVLHSIQVREPVTVACGGMSTSGP